MFAKSVAAVATIGNHPSRYPGQPVEQGNGVRQFVRLPWRQDERDSPADRVAYNAGLGSIAATRPAKRFTMVSLCRSVGFLAAPAAL